MPKISVVLAAYNAAQFLDASIRSVLNQTFQDFELIIVDDGSTDQTSVIIKKFDQEKIIHLRNEKNLGQTAALNRGILAASGEIIARVDADDLATPDLLMGFVVAFDRYPELGAIGTAKMFINEKGKFIRKWVPPLDNAAVQSTLLQWNCVPHGGAAYRSDCLKKLGYYNSELQVAQDYDLVLRLSEQWDIQNLSEPLYHYRWHDKMISNARKTEQNLAAVNIVEAAIQRRLSWGKHYLLRRKNNLPEHFITHSRTWFSKRYTWWALGARGPGKFRIALSFLILALIAKPYHLPAWDFMVGATKRKIENLFQKKNYK